MRLSPLSAAIVLAATGMAHAQGFVPMARPVGPLFSLQKNGAMLFAPLPAPVAPPVRATPAAAPPAQPAADSPGLACRRAIQTAERAASVPEHLMAAIGRIESGRREADGSINPWPWSINVEGTDHIYDSKAQAIEAVTAFQAQGIRSIDVGCMQVNLMYHPNAFASLDQAFDPMANAAYAARFLTELNKQTGSWEQATAWYHSATPGVGDAYQRKVLAVLPDERQRQPAPGGPLAATAGTGAWMLSNNAVAARVIPLPAGTAGRGLAAYRATPILATIRPITRLPL